MARTNKNTIPLGSSVSPRGGEYSSPPQLNDKESTYSELLQSSAGDDAFARLLASLGIEQTKVLTGSQRDDYNKQLLDTIINHLITQENRNYNEQLLRDQRSYDSPMSQLLRLMATGMSRDAALQALSGGSGSGGNTPYSDPSQMGSGIAPSQSRLNQVQAVTAIANTVFNGVNTLSGLVSLGFSVPQAIQQTKLLENQNVLTGAQAQAFQSSQEAAQILYAANSAAETFSNVASVTAEIERLANEGDPTAQTFINNGGIARLQQNAPYASKFLADTALTDRSYSDHATAFQQSLDVQEAQKELMGVQKSNFIQQTANLTEEFKLIQSNTNYINEQKALAAAMGLKTAAETEYINSQKSAIDLQNDLTRSTYNTEVDGKKGLEILSVSRLQQAYEIMNRFAAAKTFDLWKLEAESLSKNFEMMSTLHALEKMYYDGATDMYKDNPAYFDMCNSFRLSGGFTYIDMLIKKGMVSNSVDLGPFKFSYSGSTATTDVQFYGLTRGKEFMQWFNKKYNSEDTE